MMEKIPIHVLQGDVRISAGSEVDLHYRLLTVDKRVMNMGTISRDIYALTASVGT
jgi:hypothetical protein